MRKRITHISVHQTSKTLASMYVLLLTVLLVIPLALYTMYKGDILPGLAVLILLPAFYWLLFYLSHALFCWIYNIVAKWVGGIEFNIKEPVIYHEVDEESSEQDMSI